MNASPNVLLLPFCLLTFYTFAVGEVFQDEGSVTTLIAKCKFRSIQPYFGDRLQVGIDRNQHIYSAQQAAVVLEEFFSKNPPREFKTLLKGGSEKKMFIIGVLVTRNGSYTVSVFYTQIKGKREVIQQIRINRHDEE